MIRGDAIRYLVALVVFAGAGGGLYYEYQATRPCAAPVAYSIGSVDSQFGVSKATVLAETKDAIAIWNKAAGKAVLAYDPNAALKVNLIYDEREETAKLGVEITSKQADLEAQRATVEELTTEFEAVRTAYNAKIAAINAAGGASRRQGAELDAERAALLSEQQSVNDAVASFNAKVKALNAVVAEYNQTAGHTFEEGVYVSDAAGRRINIFEFIGTNQLERVLAHEFGHAIGLDHNEDPKSIMYAENESGNLTPTETDLSALYALCGTPAK